MILVDTNILLRLIQPAHPHQMPALQALGVLATRDQETFSIAPQSLYEMYVVVTRPASQNGLGLTPSEGLAELVKARSLFTLLPETGGVYAAWENLLTNYAITGKPAHDARLVAAMIENRVAKVLTFNDGDFRRYREIEALNPFDVLRTPRV